MGFRRHNVYLIALVVMLAACVVQAQQDRRLDQWLPFLARFRYHQTLYLIQTLGKDKLSDFQPPHGIFCNLTLGDLKPDGEIPLVLGDFKP